MATKYDIQSARDAELLAHKAYLVAKGRREELEAEYAQATYGVKIGDRVVDRKGRIGIVTRVRPWETDRPWVFAKQVRKDGKQGNREISMYADWKVA